MDNKINNKYIEISTSDGWDFYTLLFELKKHIKQDSNIFIILKTSSYGSEELVEIIDSHEEHIREEIERMNGYSSEKNKTKDVSIKNRLTCLIQQEFVKIKNYIKLLGITINVDTCTIEDNLIDEYEHCYEKKKPIPNGVNEQYLGIIKLDLYIDSNVLNIIKDNLFNKYNVTKADGIDEFYNIIYNQAKRPDNLRTIKYVKGYPYDKIKNGIFSLYYMDKINLIDFDNKKFEIELLDNKPNKESDTNIDISYSSKTKVIQINHITIDLKSLDKNLKPGIYLLYTIITDGPKSNINDYLSGYKKYQKEIFKGRSTKIKELCNPKTRLNNLGKEYGFILYQNQDKQWDIRLTQ